MQIFVLDIIICTRIMHIIYEKYFNLREKKNKNEATQWKTTREKEEVVRVVIVGKLHCNISAYASPMQRIRDEHGMKWSNTPYQHHPPLQSNTLRVDLNESEMKKKCERMRLKQEKYIESNKITISNEDETQSSHIRSPVCDSDLICVCVRRKFVSISLRQSMAKMPQRCVKTRWCKRSSQNPVNENPTIFRSHLQWTTMSGTQSQRHTTHRYRILYFLSIHKTRVSPLSARRIQIGHDAKRNYWEGANRRGKNMINKFITVQIEFHGSQTNLIFASRTRRTHTHTIWWWWITSFHTVGLGGWECVCVSIICHWTTSTRLVYLLSLQSLSDCS